MDFTRLEKLLEKEVTKPWLPGATCIVYHKGEKLFDRSFGKRAFDGENMKGNELFNFYSMTKPITCTAALQLFEQGLYDLTDPLYEYIPEFKDMTVMKMIDGRAEIVPCQRNIRIVDLFTMSSGLDYDLNKPAIKRVQERTNGRAPTVEVIKELAKEPLNFEPSTDWRYSLSHDVLGALVEVLSGERFADYMKKHIFEPLEMKDSGFESNAIDLNRMAGQYSYNAQSGVCEDVGKGCVYKLGSEYDSGGAGLVSTADDYAKFVKTMANFGVADNGEIIISKNTINLMRMNQLDEKRLKSYGLWYYERGYGYGLGVRTMLDPARGCSNGSVGEFGWDGAAGSYGLIDPDKNLAVCYIQHVLSGKGPKLHPKIRNVVYSCIYD